MKENILETIYGFRNDIEGMYNVRSREQESRII